MTYVLITIAALATSYVLYMWNALALREVRWKLYQLRDELRWRAVEDPSVATSQAFTALDARLTAHVQVIPLLTIWVVIVPLFARRQDWAAATASGRRTQKLVNDLGDAEVSRIYKATDQAFGLYALKRHPLIMTAIIAGLVGGLVGLDSWRRTSTTFGTWLDTLIGAGGDDVARRLRAA